MWTDAHCHLQLGEEATPLIARAREAGVDRMVCVGTDAKTSAEAVEIANQNRGVVYATVGLHPHDAKNGLVDTAQILEDNSQIVGTTIVGIGECGLDYYYEHSPRETQRDVFVAQIELAKRFDLALIVHTRDAWNDTLAILRSETPPPRTVIHCFTGGPDEARKCLDLGLWLSFSGIVTFKKSVEVQAAAQICPLDRMTIETDSPFLAPVPHRGKQNEPAYVGLIGRYLADAKGVELERFADSITGVTTNLFNLR